MKKTSIYLSERELEHLAWLAARTGRSQSELVREAVAAYDVAPDRDFELLRAAHGERATEPPGGGELTAQDRELRDRMEGEHREQVADALTEPRLRR